MGLRKEIAQRMRDAGFTSQEIKEFGQAKKPDGSNQEIDLIVNSAPFEHMLDSRRKWVENALKSKQLGGQGLTYREAMKIIDNYYVMKGRRKHKVSVFDWLKISYKPKTRIQTKQQFKKAITTKSVIGKMVGKNYGEKLKIRYSPTRRCSHCKGSGMLRNLYGQNQTCIYCNGTGVERKQFG